LRKRLKGLHGPDIAKGFGASALGTLGMIVALIFWMRVGGSLHAGLTTLGGVAIGGAVYGAGLSLLRIPEFGRLVKMIKRRFSR